MPFFSVIIPTYNRKNFLKKAIESVLAQTDPDFELMIIDDGSTDGTQALVAQYGDARICYHYQQRCGVAAARNQGLAWAQGLFIAFLDSDDWWRAEKLTKFRQAIVDDPDYKIFHSEEVWYRKGRRLYPKRKHRKPDGRVYQQALPLCCISISTAVLHRDVFKKVGVFDESFEACEDYDFWLRATHSFPVRLIPEYLTEKDGGRPDQLSMSVWGLDRFRIQALIKMLSSGMLNEKDYTATLAELKKKAGVFIKGAEKRGQKAQVLYYQDLIQQYHPTSISDFKESG